MLYHIFRRNHLFRIKNKKSIKSKEGLILNLHGADDEA